MGSSITKTKLFFKTLWHIEFSGGKSDFQIADILWDDAKDLLPMDQRTKYDTLFQHHRNNEKNIPYVERIMQNKVPDDIAWLIKQHCLESQTEIEREILQAQPEMLGD